ncbi:homoserine kinase [Salana multivorans]|uniref:Homoserine kinase n=1 Tax=Salana multivorans TaxID=120377 RepID=A0A3N2D7B7_9MICO|nr:homoserine kinase [Salana multivorans]MBN8881347.1 homoserine kinase [Salana multivorans]OJX98278.1 MAG: homoserine kinase [Micrococcales bacterium 73-15]ROR95671.1 homoserine kinase [Salana multivorans]
MRIVTDAVTVRVPATSANLGPGFDAFGLALGLHDEVRVRATTGGTTTRVTGEGAGSVPEGERHLVVQAIRAGLEIARAPQVGLDLEAFNAIPHGRGLGSSAAAVVAGLVAARGFLSEPEALSNEVILDLATEWEGHPDNAAAAIYGGATIAWRTPVPGAAASAEDDGGRSDQVDAVRVEVDPTLVVTALVPDTELATKVARSVLPPTVPHADAAFAAGRAALLTLALQGHPELRMAATEDRLHQPYRGQVLGASMALVGWLRSAGQPAVISGAGPTVLVLGEVPAAMRETLAAQGWRPLVLPVDREGARLV